MSDAFHRLRMILRGEEEMPADSGAFPEVCHKRLLSALRASGSSKAPGPADLACLVRHVLRREDEIQRGNPQNLLVPLKPPWPDRVGWRRFGIEARAAGADHYIVRATPWMPEWLPQSQSSSPELPAFAEHARRNFEPVAGDPFLPGNYPDYLNVGQREAMRAVLTAPPGSTLVVNLPTGSGKSLCVHLPAFLHSRRTGVTVVIVPTTALAIDQERSVSSLIDHPTAYYGDGTNDGVERRSEIRARIREGTQRIVFTSPESIVGSLAGPLYDAANRDHLRMFVVDEAHIIDQWGDNFRSDFQVIPGFRRDLLRSARTPFPTLLMTGTLTESCFDTLEALFGEPGPFELLATAQLRPEPSYWFSLCRSEEEKIEQTLEAIRHLPRPLILYTTMVADAYRWAQELRHMGLRRYAVVTGESSSDERRRVIDDWQARRVDLIVATSAFGLGVDQADVRAVVHACVPETIDRYYQEVGRGGRDGKAAVSLTIYTPEDLRVAKRLNRKTFIGIKRGRQRWQRMFEEKEVIANNRYRVRVSVTPSLRWGDIDMNNRRNRDWNVRTLTLMSRAGLIRMDSEPPPVPQDHDSLAGQHPAEYLEALEMYHERRVIQIRNEHHLDIATWEDHVEPLRSRLQAFAARNLALMKEALKGRQCIADFFSEAYTIPSRQDPTPRGGVHVSPSCGGCTFCRANGIAPYAGVVPLRGPAWRSFPVITGPELRPLLGERDALGIFYDQIEMDPFGEQRFYRLLRWFVDKGVRNVVAPQEILERFNRENDNEAVVFLFDSFDPLRLPRVPTLIFHRRGAPPIITYLTNESLPRVLLLPFDSPDPRAPHRRLFQTFEGRKYRMNAFFTEFGI